MLITDILPAPRVVLEYGRHNSFPGFGMGLFSQRFYQYMATQLQRIADPHAREWLTDWLADAFRRDNGRFKEDLFKRAVAAGKRYDASPLFQQRHFYYLAHLVSQITDPHIHEFVADWVAKVAGGTNPQFQRAHRDRFCGTSDRQTPEAD